jgi:hypothetical protein
MPNTCFSYPADRPTDAGDRNIALGIRAREAVPSALHSSKLCFSYSTGVPLDAWNRNITRHGPHDSKLCFSY